MQISMIANECNQLDFNNQTSNLEFELKFRFQGRSLDSKL